MAQKGYIRENFDDEDEKYHSVLSRRDLSANNDETQSHLDLANAKTPRDFMHDLQSRSRGAARDNLPRGGKNLVKHDGKERLPSDPRRQIYNSNGSPSALYHQGLQSILSSEHNQNQRLSIIQTSLLSSNNQDYRVQNNNGQVDTTNIIFEQPTREEMGDTYKRNIPISRAGEFVVSEESRQDDLSNIIDQACMSEMQSS